MIPSIAALFSLMTLSAQSTSLLFEQEKSDDILQGGKSDDAFPLTMFNMLGVTDFHLLS